MLPTGFVAFVPLSAPPLSFKKTCFLPGSTCIVFDIRFMIRFYDNVRFGWVSPIRGMLCGSLSAVLSRVCLPEQDSGGLGWLVILRSKGVWQ